MKNTKNGCISWYKNIKISHNSMRILYEKFLCTKIWILRRLEVRRLSLYGIHVDLSLYSLQIQIEIQILRELDL